MYKQLVKDRPRPISTITISLCKIQQIVSFHVKKEIMLLQILFYLLYLIV